MVCIFPHRHLVKIQMLTRKISYHIMLTQKSYVHYELHRYLLRAIYDHNEYSVNTSFNEPSIYPLLMILQWSV